MKEREKMIVEYVRQLSGFLSGVSPSVEQEKLREMHRKKRFTDMVAHICIILGLNLRMRVGFVVKGGHPEAPAWITKPSSASLYGTSDFKNMLVTMYIRKMFLKRVPFETAVLAMAHEISHVVIDVVGLKFENKEEAVDLAAMLLGFRDFYRAGCIIKIGAQSLFQKIIGYFYRVSKADLFVQGVYRVGYLTAEEVNFAADIMDKLFSK